MDGIGTTGYGRFTMGQEFKAELVQEELSVNAKGAVYLADCQKGEATVLDIGGMDNKVITVNNGIQITLPWAVSVQGHPEGSWT